VWPVYAYSEEIPVKKSVGFIATATEAWAHSKLCYVILDDSLTVHRSITLVDLQLDAQNSYLFTYNTFIKILYMFRALLCSSSGGLHHNFIYMQPLVSSLSAGDCLVHRCTRH